MRIYCLKRPKCFLPNKCFKREMGWRNENSVFVQMFSWEPQLANCWQFGWNARVGSLPQLCLFWISLISPPRIWSNALEAKNAIHPLLLKWLLLQFPGRGIFILTKCWLKTPKYSGSPAEHWTLPKKVISSWAKMRVLPKINHENWRIVFTRVSSVMPITPESRIARGPKTVLIVVETPSITTAMSVML